MIEMKLIITFLISLLIGCHVSVYRSQNKLKLPSLHCHSYSRQCVNVNISSYFTQEEADLIRLALDNWTIATFGDIEFIYDSTKTYDMYVVYLDTNTLIVKQSDTDTSRLAGYTEKPAIELVADRLITDKLFIVITMHEAGHWMGMKHLPGINSIMYYQYQEHQPGKITDADIAEYYRANPR